MTGYPRIIAHRCGGALAPENTLAGLAAAARIGCQAVEFDVMLTADRVPILIHDETLDRTTGCSGRVAGLTLTQIRARASQVPTLAEAMAVCRRHDFWVNIELKPAAGHEADTGEVVGAWLAEHWDGRGVVSSFSQKSALAGRRHLPDAPFALLYEVLPADWQADLAQLAAVAVHLDAHQVDHETVKRLGGVPWAAWTVNDCTTAERLFALGCAAVFTDRRTCGCQPSRKIRRFPRLPSLAMNRVMSCADIREKFLKFFESKGHQIVASSSLVPFDDPTLLFTNAGMNQFKDVFLGFDKRPYNRATTSQKCVRAGGKHNDLENVGYTARHHTFFEMLGNFSFGDYFKQDAIRYAWELLTEVYGLPKDKLWVTVYAEDDEAYDIWTKEIGVPVERTVRIGDNKGARYMSDNFWMMGDTGPCGPCTEIFYDHGPEIPGGPPGSPEEDGDRYIEIWNNVFMQFNRDEAGVMHPLPKPSVDTGMGLERIAAVLQHVHSNYEIDLMQTLVKAAARETNTSDLLFPSLRVLADHIRACAFLLADGVIPGNEGRGFVLRRIIRRAIRHGYKLGVRVPFFHKLVPDLVAEMGVAYPDLARAQGKVMEVLKLEEERFFATIEHGMAIVEADLAEMARNDSKIFNGDTAFKLHDTYGFPLDLTADICRERGVTVDAMAFDAAMARQKEQARAAGKFKMAAALEYAGPATTFHGYAMLETQGNVLALYKDGAPVNELVEGEVGVVVLDDTPFYAESGGQCGDRGVLQSVHGIFAVEDTQKIQASVFGHHGIVKTGTIKVGNGVTAKVDLQARARTVRNHSATHLMHKALREVLGEHVQQKGSQVDPDKTRFDFVHHQPMTNEEIRRVETLVNAEILANAAAESKVMPLADAQKTGAMMLFGEKYGDEVRVCTIGSSKELCGGTHVSRTGDIGFFTLVAEGGVAAGVRRVEALTGDNALAYVQGMEQVLGGIAGTLKVVRTEAPARVNALLDQVKRLERELAGLKGRLASAQGDDLVSHAIDIKGIKVLATVLEGADVPTLRETMDKLKDKLKSAAIVLAAVTDGKVSLIAGVTADLTSKVKAGELVNSVAQQIGGKGGGRPDMAQAGGTQPEHLPAALASVQSWVEKRL